MASAPTVLSVEQKQSLYHDGYVIVRNAVSSALVATALTRIKAAKKGESLAGTKELTDLVNASAITAILHEAMGQFDPPSACQVGVLKPRPPGDHFNNLGYRDKDMPYYGAELHMDGNITMAAPQEIQEGTPDEIYARYIASGPKGDLGRSPKVMGHNFTPLFQDPEMTLALGSFTAFVFVCLNDQTAEGCGQTSLLPGAHHATEQFFRWQYETSGHLGPEGPGWPRLNIDSPNRCGMNYLPNAILEQFTDDSCACTPDGRRWPRPVQVLMEPGDACIAMYNIPHSGSRNEHGTASRKNIIFRIRNKKRQPDKVLTGLSDHPDRGWLGDWLDFEEGNNPWERSKHAMFNMWEEWEGMQEVVAQERRRV
jgi:ectoine hydroxylase-related dioxygenase (phytanoyl-CoA dioxygenase family)